MIDTVAIVPYPHLWITWKRAGYATGSVPPDKIVRYISPEEIDELAGLMKALPLTPRGLLGFDWSIVTAGGVDLKETDPRTMASRLVHNIFFAGEILDLDGPSGGFNLQACWSTGYIAGESAAAVNAPEAGKAKA
ncbi:MAG: hypothetical protein GX310_05655 [Synergistaceae bacterium]|nr:hypothetical protein [Synergistaceae bacterium]